jgi:hypothetical protein
MKTETISCRFIGDFKVGDNMVYNAGLLCKLAESGGTFNKLMLLQAGAITEAALWEIIYRAQNFNREGVPNISEEDRAEIEGKKVERFKAIIDVMKKYKILDKAGADIYDELDKLREYRNKVHIQLDVKLEGVPRDEDKAFTDPVRDWALKLNVRVLKFLTENFARPADLAQFAHSITVPSP